MAHLVPQLAHPRVPTGWSFVLLHLSMPTQVSVMSAVAAFLHSVEISSLPCVLLCLTPCGNPSRSAGIDKIHSFLRWCNVSLSAQNFIQLIL